MKRLGEKRRNFINKELENGAAVSRSTSRSYIIKEGFIQ